MKNRLLIVVLMLVLLSGCHFVFHIFDYEQNVTLSPAPIDRLTSTGDDLVKTGKAATQSHEHLTKELNRATENQLVLEEQLSRTTRAINDVKIELPTLNNRVLVQNLLDALHQN